MSIKNAGFGKDPTRKVRKVGVKYKLPSPTKQRKRISSGPDYQIPTPPPKPPKKEAIE